MSFLNFYINDIIKKDRINLFYKGKYVSKNILDHVEINFFFNNSKIENRLSCILALEYVFSQKSFLMQSKTPSIILNIKKGVPIGVRLVLRKRKMKFFLEKFLFTELALVKKPFIYRLFKISILKYTISSSSIFKWLNFDYKYFKTVSSQINISLVFNSSDFKTVDSFIFKSLKIKDAVIVTQLVECNLAKVEVEGSNPFYY